MAYSNETTHFGFPLPLATDLTVPMDYNESLEAADTALFEAQTNAAGAVGTAGNALTVANEAKTEAQSATSAAASAAATAQAAATAANEAVAAVAEAKDDALDMICAVVEETATAQYKHEPTKDGLNYYFRYNDILYKTTAVINVGETIVPNTNCAATNVATELSAGGTGESASDVSYDNTDSGLNANNVQAAIDELAGGTTGGGVTTLWTNETPAASFGATTVNVDVASYDVTLVEYKVTNSNDTRGTTLIIANGSYRMMIGSDSTRYRDVTVSDTAFAFGGGHQDATDTNTAIIPLHIYGIKF